LHRIHHCVLIALQARGGGYERSEYATSDLVFCDIQNIHVMRDSVKKLQDACLQLINDDKHWFVNLEQSQWFHHGKVSIYSLQMWSFSVEFAFTFASYNIGMLCFLWIYYTCLKIYLAENVFSLTQPYLDSQP